MIDPLLLLTVQAVLIWVIVFCAAMPLPKLPDKLALIIALISTSLILLEVTIYDNAGLFVTVAIAGYSWGTIVHHCNEKKNSRKEHEYLDDK